MADNTFATAQIKVEAETSKAEQALKDLRAKLDGLGQSLDELKAKQAQAVDVGEQFGKVNVALDGVRDAARDVNSLMRVMTVLEAPLRVAEQYFKLGQSIESVGEKLLGLNDDIGAAMQALADQDKSPVARMKKELEALQKELLDGGVVDMAKRSVFRILDAAMSTDMAAAYDQRMAPKIKELGERIARQEQEDIRHRIEKNRIATLDGVEKLEAEKAEAIRMARVDLEGMPGVDGTEYIQSISNRFDFLIKKEKEADDTKDERDRARRLNHIRQVQEDLAKEEKDRKAMEDRIAEHAREAMSRALESVARQYDALTNGNRVAMTLDAINANLKALVNKRQGY